MSKLIGIIALVAISGQCKACFTNMECFNGAVCVKPYGGYQNSPGICMAQAVPQYQIVGAKELTGNPADIARDYQANQRNNLEMQKLQLEIERLRSGH